MVATMKMNAVTGPVDHRALLATIRGRLVRAVAGEQGPYSDALFEVLAQRSRNWSFEDWQAALREIDRSTQTVEDFLSAEHVRPKS
jgi:hypothetical protein